jgi:predicted transcriptional regulator
LHVVEQGLFTQQRIAKLMNVSQKTVSRRYREPIPKTIEE